MSAGVLIIFLKINAQSSDMAHNNNQNISRSILNVFKNIDKKIMKNRI
jgi:hypothetical protein